MTCNKCYAQNPESSRFCYKCGAPLGQETPVEPQEQAVNPQSVPVTAEYVQAANHMNQYANEATKQYYGTASTTMPYQPPKKKEYTWSDICTVVGFTCSIVGLFYFWLILCPVGLLTSFLGFRANRTKALAVAGVIISFVGIIIKIGYILYQMNILPSWLTSGVL